MKGTPKCSLQGASGIQHSLQLQFEGLKVGEANCSVGNKKIAVNIILPESRIKIQFTSPPVIHEGEALAIGINKK